MKCPNCGTDNPDDATSCKVCGNLLENTLEAKDAEIVSVDSDKEANADENSAENNNSYESAQETQDQNDNYNQQQNYQQNYDNQYQNPEYNNQGYNNQYQNQEYDNQYQNPEYNNQNQYNQQNQGYSQQPNYNQYSHYNQQPNYNQGYNQQIRTPVTQKSKGLAIILGFFIPGAGICYANKWGEGIAHFVIFWILWVVGLLTLGIGWIIMIIVWIYSLIKTSEYVDAYNRGELY